MADVFVEVNEAMKQERMEKLWQRYGGFFIGFLVMIILGTAANAGYKSWKTNKNLQQTDLFLETLTGQGDKINNLLTVSANFDDGLREVANIRAAGLSLKNGDNEKALQIYQNIAQDKSANSALKQLADYMIISLSDNMDREIRLSKLDIIILNEENPWRYHAFLDAALLEAQANNYEAARAHLTVILKNNAAPQTLRQKAQSLDILYNLKEKI